MAISVVAAGNPGPSVALILVDALEGFVHPAIGIQPSRIGLRHLGASVLFVLLMFLADAWIE